MIEEICSINDEFLPLTAVSGIFNSMRAESPESELGMLRAVLFEFEKLGFAIVCDQERDRLNTIPLSEFLPLPNDHKKDLSKSLPWSAVFGRPFLWAWELRNFSGGAEGFQFYFTFPDRIVPNILIINDNGVIGIGEGIACEIDQERTVE